MSLWPQAKPRRITGRMVLAGMAAFFALVLGVNGVFLYLALDSFPGVDTENAYRKGLNYGETLAADAAQKALGWRASLDWWGAGPGRGRIVLRLTDAAGAPVRGRVVSLTLRRPVHAGEDRAVTLRETSSGAYAADVALPAPGNWDAIAEVSHGGRAVFRLQQRIIVP